MPQPLADMCSNTCWLLIPCFHCHQGSLQWCFRHPSCRRPNTSSRSVESSKQWNLRFKNVPNAYHHIPRDTTNCRVTQQVLVSASAGGKRVAIAAARWLFLHNPAITNDICWDPKHFANLEKQITKFQAQTKSAFGPGKRLQTVSKHNAMKGQTF